MTTQSGPRAPIRSAHVTFWIAATLTGVLAGGSGTILLLLLKTVEDWAWRGAATSNLADAASRAGAWRHLALLFAAGMIAATGGLLLRRLRSGNGNDLMEAIWFHQGRLPPLQTLGSGVLSIIVVGLGAPLGKEGAPKQAGGVMANLLANLGHIDDPSRRLLVACGAGAGMAAAYGVPLGGALFALEVLHDGLTLDAILPALLTSLVAAATSWIVLPNAVTYAVPAYTGSPGAIGFALVASPLIGLAGVAIVRAVAWADRHRPQGSWRIAAPILALAVVGTLSIALPDILGNGKDPAQHAFAGSLRPTVAATLTVAKPLAVFLCIAAGVPGGLFTPTLATGAVLGTTLGHLWPGVPPGLCALLAATALLAVTTRGPISSIVLVIELTGYDRASVVPTLLVVILATGVAQVIDRRSIYEARLSDSEVAIRLRGPGHRTAVSGSEPALISDEQ